MSMLRMTTAGESHGPAEVCVLTGVPAGLTLTTAHIDLDLARRQRGYGRGGRMGIEQDACRLLSGVRHGVTLGTPIAIVVENRDHLNWGEVMSPAPPDATQALPAPLAVPRPGHADFAGVLKYGHTDVRNVLERASARETVGRVAGGAVCRRLLGELGVSVKARVVAIGSAVVGESADFDFPDRIDWEGAETSPVGCDNPEASDRMCRAIDDARGRGESLGGVFEVWCWGVCPGLGGYATSDERLDGRLLGALGSVPAIKGAEIGRAFADAGRPGSEVHDPFFVEDDGAGLRVGRKSNNAGGIEGGMSNGRPIVVRAAMKPIPTLTTPLPSVDLGTLEPVDAHVERSDIAAVPAARVVGEAMVAYVIASAYLEKFGGDSLTELRRSIASYESDLEERGLWRRS